MGRCTHLTRRLYSKAKAKLRRLIKSIDFKGVNGLGKSHWHEQSPEPNLVVLILCSRQYHSRLTMRKLPGYLTYFYVVTQNNQTKLVGLFNLI